MKHFKFYNKEDVLSITKLRKYHSRVGERVQVIKAGSDDMTAALRQSSARYVLLGIPEDIGVKANYGVGGADTAWLPFLHSLLNFESNDFFPADNILLLGHFDFGDVKFLIENNALSQEEMIEAYRHALIDIDSQVEDMVKSIVGAGKIPIVIGGGQNNAYPIIKATAKSLHKFDKIPIAQINAINVSATSGFAAAEGRHSGNAFRYAGLDGYLGKYCIVGLQETAIPQGELMDVHGDPFIDFVSYEEIFIRERRNFIQAISHATGFTEDNYTGLELNMNAIAMSLSSHAAAPGIGFLHARQYLSFAAQDSKVAYLHITEGAVQLKDGRRNEFTGQVIATLVADFVKEHQEIKQN
jgi:formiminoglutamase